MPDPNPRARRVTLEGKPVPPQAEGPDEEAGEGLEPPVPPTPPPPPGATPGTPPGKE